MSTKKNELNLQPLDDDYGCTFGMVIDVLRERPEKRAYRKSWKRFGGNFIVVMPSLQLPPFSTGDTNRKVNDRTARHIGENTPLNSKPYLAMGDINGDWQPGWIPTQEDIFGIDWVIE